MFNVNSSPEHIKSAFQTLLSNKQGTITNQELRTFITDNFNPAGEELETWSPTDVPRV